MTPTTVPLRADIAALLPRMRRFARIVCRSGDDADDLVQLAIERALKGGAQWQADGRLDCAMLRLMVQARGDQLHGRERGEPAFAAEPAGSAAGEALQPDMAMLWAVARLNEAERMVIGLVLVDGLSYQAAAQVLEIAPAALGGRLLRARDALQRRLSEQAREMP
ncbi:RNA polymerase sigma factor [Janthinobacterium fluminis]|uniref:Sigma factor-like helix-turn-helix DNA-binding protein n=1 Tax=Janthinobacterium fluminis TaxID=2987524 RepID=A0ABT5JXD1_9BURK|nr:sigma factor-like helix-turn-helix DNA-binding protein [Janthinobacterium fluminis]MDC8757229.1 sigma factor-like helix-turn-helix DNA-binding protein [Janthinobacterium fluminis]